MKETVAFVFFLSFVFFLALSKDWRLFLAVVFLALPFVRLKRLFALLILLVVVSLPYLFFHPSGLSPWGWMLMFNLRAMAMALSSAAFFSFVNLLKALSFSRTLRALFSLSYAQFSSYKRTYGSFYSALRSRTLRKRLGRSFFPYAGAVFSYFYRLSEKRAGEMNQALRSRGFYV